MTLSNLENPVLIDSNYTLHIVTLSAHKLGAIGLQQKTPTLTRKADVFD
jgi:hypothetical protein